MIKIALVSTKRKTGEPKCVGTGFNLATVGQTEQDLKSLLLKSLKNDSRLSIGNL